MAPGYSTMFLLVPMGPMCLTYAFRGLRTMRSRHQG
jgi:hypothetical protein